MYQKFLMMWCGVFMATTTAAQSLKVSAIPDEAPTELQRKFAPLGTYLGKEIGMKVEFIPVTDYAAVVEGLASNKLDLAWLGGFTFVQARLRTGNAIPIAQREEDKLITSKFIANAASGINGLYGPTQDSTTCTITAAITM